jgi:DNA-binding GntR family transcriptional regulator
MSGKLLKLKARTDYVDEVYRVLLDAISDGSLAPGSRLTQEEIAAQLEVSRSPVLQALRLLKKDGLVLDAPGRGLLVAPLDAQWISHLYEVRGALDALAAQLAAARGAKIDKSLIADGRRAAKNKDLKALIEADCAFHTAIYAASGNPLIGETAHLHWVHLRRAMGAVLQISAQLKNIWDDHAAIAEAIAEGDAERAAALSKQHTDQARCNLVARIGEVLTLHSA